MRDQLSKAQEWVEKYPFLRFKNNDCCPWQNTEEVESCWIFDLPTGWIDTCAKDMCDELLEALGKCVDDFVILQLKEKFNEIRLYWCWEDKEYTDVEIQEHNRLYDVIENILRKYADISYKTCTICGAQATKYTNTWITGFCDNCYERTISKN